MAKRPLDLFRAMAEQPAMTDVHVLTVNRRGFVVPAVLLAAVALALLLRGLVIAPFSVPSPSMLPLLMPGDQLVVARWSQPDRGDVVVFRVGDGHYVKRLIGLPGDRVQMLRGRLILNGTAIPRRRLGNLSAPCPGATRPNCPLAHFREWLPNGRSYEILQPGGMPKADTTGELIVPPAHYFMLGDNRDDSEDSRFPAGPEGGIGYVAGNDLVGPVETVWFSTDGSASWWQPWRWSAAIRWSRIGIAV